MIIKSSFVRLIFFLSFVLIFPLIQKQWFNLYLFNINNNSFYSILYYFSGIILPVLVSFNSIYEFTNYKFKYFVTDRIIKGKSLLFIVLIILLPLSFLIINYFYISLHLISNVFFNRNLYTLTNHTNNIYLILIICILLIFRKTRIIVKKLTLVNFIIFSLVIWHASFNDILISDKLLINNFAIVEFPNYLNLFLLFLIELFYYFWSYLSNKNNLSNWSIPIPHKNYYLHIFNITFLFLISILYYSIIK